MLDVFNDYISRYDISEKKLNQKYTHTMRVQKLCEDIARSINLSEEDVKLASMCGLFHDIGRFEQINLFDSYDDFSTIDHGDLGHDIFIEHIAPILNISNKDKNIISKSILYHNKFKVNNVTERERLFINITRDADKLDIFNVYINEKGYFKEYEGQISDSVRKDFFKHELINRKNINNQRDTNISALAFIWDFNYDYSYEFIKQNNYIEQIEKILNNKVYEEYFKEIKNFLKEK